MTKFISFILILVCFSYCNEKKSSSHQAVAKDSSAIKDQLYGHDNSFFSFERKPEIITVSSEKKSRITGKKGLKLIIDPTSLEAEDGSPVSGNITVELTEMVTQEDLFNADASTNSDGQLLVSGGAYHLEMKNGDRKLRIKKDKSLVMQCPKYSNKEMELFYGQKDSSGNLNWVPAKKPIRKITGKPELTPGVAKNPGTQPQSSPPITKDTAKSQDGSLTALLDFAEKKGNRISASELDSFLDKRDLFENDADLIRVTKEETDVETGEKKKVSSKVYYEPVEIRKLGWINCDRYYQNPNKTKINCDLQFVEQTDKASIYIVFNNINSLIKEYAKVSDISKPYELSFDFPVGEPVKLIAITNNGEDIFIARANYKIEKNGIVALKFNKAAKEDINKIKLY